MEEWSHVKPTKETRRRLHFDALHRLGFKIIYSGRRRFQENHLINTRAAPLLRTRARNLVEH